MREREIIQHRQIEGLSLFFDTVDYRTPHFHPEWELIWITEGALTVRFGSEERLSRAGDLLLFYPGQVHEFQKAGESATFLCLQIAPKLFANAAPAFVHTALEDSCINRYLDKQAERRLRQSLQKLLEDYLEQPPFYELSCVGKCAEILYQLLSALPGHSLTEDERAQTDQRNARLERFIRFVDERYMNKIRLSDFASAEGCSTSYISRFIKASLNQNFQEYVNSVRFHCACRLIAMGGKKMLDVCEESGFSDYRYFSAVFKKNFGLTPEEYSRQMAGMETEPVCRSLHSLERFYTREQSRLLLQELQVE